MENNIIGIFSGKGGVGKTTLTVNLAISMVQFNKNVIAVDTDLKMSGLGLHLNMYKFPTTINDVLSSTKNLLDALYIHSSGIRIVPAPVYAEDVDTSRLKEVLANPYISNSYVLLDSPPGLEKNAIDVISACNSAIILTTPEVPAVTDALKIVDKINKMNVNILGLVINMSDKDSQLDDEEIESALGVKIIGKIPFDKNVRKSLSFRQPLMIYNPYSPASVEIKKIAAKILNEKYENEKFLIFKRIFKGIKK
ncbi:MAG: cell division ATPase MinD [Candidatus Aenigmatarchaeota archaeon]|nr:cell division ATPase MinD [Candidatus Aenigmarchaeota archaeon]